jgi:predicted cupin superfamily sugar epimerase
MNTKAEFYINKLQLIPHPEGGFYKEIYRSTEEIPEKYLPARYKGERSYSSSIYFLLEGNSFSSFHRLKSDEIWHFYDGSSVKIYVINQRGKISENILGKDIEQGEEIQFIINKDCWFAAEVLFKSSFSLFGCTVSPGFDFNDFELGRKENLIKIYPQHKTIIEKLTRY